MSEDPKEKKKKKKSLSKQIAELRESLRNEDSSYWKLYHSRQRLENELLIIQKILPKKYYKIKYKIRANSGGIFEYEETHQGYNIEHAIYKLKENKTHPDTFELLDCKILGD